MKPNPLGRGARLLLGVSLALNAAVAAAAGSHVARRGGVPYLRHKLGIGSRGVQPRPFQLDKVAVFRALPSTDGEVVFAGDSHVAGTPFAEVYTPVRNRGVGGETTAGLLARLDEITRRQPESVFLEIGANDVAQSIPLEETMANYTEIMRRLRLETPDSRVFVLSVPPTCPDVRQRSTDRNPQIRKLNERIAALAAAEGATFVDLTPILTDPQGNLKPEFATVDGLHLTTEAQLKVCERLRSFLPPQLTSGMAVASTVASLPTDGGPGAADSAGIIRPQGDASGTAAHGGTSN